MLIFYHAVTIFKNREGQLLFRMTEYMQDTETVEGYVEAFNTKFSYGEAVLESLTGQDKLDNYTWNPVEERVILEEFEGILEKHMENRGHDISIDYSEEDQGYREFESEDGQVKVKLNTSEKMIEPGEESRFSELYPGMHVEMEVPSRQADSYKKSLKGITSGFEKRFV